MQKKNTIASGALILLLANLLVKVVGMGFKIPLHHLLADEGMGYFNAAYNLYAWFFMISTTGLPVAISTLVAEQSAKKDAAQIGVILRMALALFFVIGLLGSGAMLFFASAFSDAAGMPQATLSVCALAPTLLFACLSGALRGYFQGKQQMLPTALSQVAEAVGKLVLGILFALYATGKGYPIHRVSAYAIAGVTVGSMLSVLLLALWKIFERDTMIVDKNRVSAPLCIPKRLFALVRVALPVTLASSVLSLTSVLDTVLVPARLQYGAGYAPQAAVALFGNYTTLAVPLFHAPTILLYPITCALLPALSAAGAAGDTGQVDILRRGGMRAVAMLSLPTTLGLSLFAEPILRLLYRADSAALAAPQLSVLSVGIFFYGTVAVTNAFLQAGGKAWCLVPSALCGVLVKLVVTYLLTGVPQTAIYGAPAGTVLCYFTMAVCNLYAVRRSVGKLPDSISLYARPLAVSVLCVICGGAVYFGMRYFRIPTAICTLSGIGIAALSYGVGLLLLGALTEKELAMLPFGRVLARICTSKENRKDLRGQIGKERKQNERDPQTTGRKNKVRHGGSACDHGNPACARRMSVGR